MIAKALSGAAAPLPPRREMLHDADAFERSLESEGIARRHAHRMGDAQFAYNDELRALCGNPPLATWRAEMYAATGARKRSEPASYRDGPIPWSDEAARAAARAEADGGGVRDGSGEGRGGGGGGVMRISSCVVFVFHLRRSI